MNRISTMGHIITLLIWLAGTGYIVFPIYTGECAVRTDKAINRIQLINPSFENSYNNLADCVPGWTLSTNNRPYKPGISQVSEKPPVEITSEVKYNGKQSLKATIKPGPYCFSIYQKVPPAIGPSDTISINMYLKTSYSVNLGIWLCANPGGLPPYRKWDIEAKPSPAWQKETLRTVMFFPQGRERYFEIQLQGEAMNPVTLYIDNISIQKETPVPDIILFSPQSGVLFDKLDDGNLLLNTTYPVDTGKINIKLLSNDRQYARKLVPIEINVNQIKSKLPKDMAAGSYKIDVTDTSKGLKKTFNVRKIHLKEPYTVVHNGVPYVNGKPALIIGIFHASQMALGMVNSGHTTRVRADDSTPVNSPGNLQTGIKPLTFDDMLSSLNEKGFNAVHYTSTLPPMDYMESASKHNMMVLPQSTCNNEWLGLAGNTPLLCWYARDEASGSAQQLEKDYEESTRLDSMHPVLGSLSSGRFGWSSSHLENVKYADIIAPDQYEIGGPLSDVDPTYVMLKDADTYMIKGDPRRCLFLIPQLFTALGPYMPEREEYYGWSNGCEPSYKQVRAQVYTGIIAGAKGILYYAYTTTEGLYDGMKKNPKRKFWYLPESALWDDIGKLNSELASLKDIILLGKPSDAITFEGKVRYSVKTLGNKIYVFLCNTWPDQKTVHFKKTKNNLTFHPVYDSKGIPAGKVGSFIMNGHDVVILRADIKVLLK